MNISTSAFLRRGGGLFASTFGALFYILFILCLNYLLLLAVLDPFLDVGDITTYAYLGGAFLVLYLLPCLVLCLVLYHLLYLD